MKSAIFFQMGVQQSLLQHINTVPLKSKLPSLVSFLARRKSRLISCETKVSPRETRLSSREMRLSSCENHWRVYFGINYKQLACEKTINFSRHGEVYPARASGFAGSCFTCRIKGANFNLQAKNVNESDEKRTSKTFAKTRVWRSL